MRHNSSRSGPGLAVLLVLVLILAGIVVTLRVNAAHEPMETDVPQLDVLMRSETPAPTAEAAAAPEPAPLRTEGPFIEADPLADVPLDLPEGASPDNLRAWYYAVLTRILNEYGRCEAEYEGWGLAYANLVDFDGDGMEELYLYYVDDDAGVAGVRGYKGKVVHEEIWRGKNCIYRHHHWDSSDPADEELDSDGRALCAIGSGVSLCAAGRVTHLGEDRFRAERLSFTSDSVSEQRVTARFLTNSPSAVLDSELLAAYGLQEGEMQNGAAVSVFSDGTLTRDGKTKDVDFREGRASFTSTYTEAGGLPTESAIRVQDYDPDGLLDTLVSLRSFVQNGQRLIFADDYIQIYEDSYVHFHWVLGDIDSMMLRLERTMG